MKKTISALVLTAAAFSLFGAAAKKNNPNLTENSDGTVSITNIDKDSSVKFNQKYEGEKNITIVDGNKITKNNPITFDLSDFADKEIMLQFSCDIKIEEAADENLDLNWMINDFEAGMPTVAREIVKSNQWSTIKGETVLVLGQKKSFYLSGAGMPKAGSKYYIKNLSLVLNGENLTGAPVPPVAWTDAPSLKDAYAKYFDHFGLACTYRGELQRKEIQDGIEHLANSITMGNEFKPDFMFSWAKPTTFEDFVAEDGNTYKMPIGLPNFTTVNTCLHLAKRMGVQMRGHVLVWHSQTPAWFFKKDFSAAGSAEYVDKAEMTARQEWYIKSVLEYVNDWEAKNNNGERIVYTWDVVNEAIADGAGVQKWLREDSDWFRVYGNEEFIINAFRFANKYAPADVTLVYNDYGLASAGKRGALCNLIDEIKATPDARIDAVGLQSHVKMDTRVNLSDGPNSYEEAIQEYVKHGVDVQITELDIANNKSKYSPMMLKAKFKDFFKMYIRNRAKDGQHGITSTTIWGLTDKGTWLDNQTEYKGYKQYPLLLNEDYSCKPAFFGVLEAAEESE